MTPDCIRRLAQESEGDEERAPKRLRFTDVQRAALEELGERSQWSLPGLSREDRDAFCILHNISRVRVTSLRVPVCP